MNPKALSPGSSVAELDRGSGEPKGNHLSGFLAQLEIDHPKVIDQPKVIDRINCAASVYLPIMANEPLGLQCTHGLWTPRTVAHL